MKRILIAVIFLTNLTLAYNQSCGLENPIDLPLNAETTHTLTVDGYFNDDLSNPNQGVCGVNIHLLHNLILDLEIELVSPTGQRLTLIGPDLSTDETRAGTVLNIGFVRCDSTPDPDFIIGNQYRNDPVTAGSYKGSYWPFGGCLESAYNIGPVNGDWTIVARSTTIHNLTPNQILDFSIIFCDDSGNPCCFADAGRLNTGVDYSFCPGDTLLDASNPSSTFLLDPAYPPRFNRDPDPDGTGLEYDYMYAISIQDTIVAFQDIVNMVSFEPGDYQVCGLSYQVDERADLLALVDTMTINRLDTDLSGPSPSFCADLTDECIQVVINPTSVTNLDTLICPGESLVIGDSTYTLPGNYQVPLLNQAGCDSIVNVAFDFAVIPDVTIDTAICEGESVVIGATTFDAPGNYTEVLASALGCDSTVILNLEVIPIPIVDVDSTICKGDSVQIGNQFFGDSGTFQVTLTSADNCDSLVNLDLTVVDVDVDILTPDTLKCFTASVTLDGSNSSSNLAGPLTYRWGTIPGGTISDSSRVAVAVSGDYFLEVSTIENGLTCAVRDTVTVLENLTPPIVDAGVPDTLTCVQTSVVLNGSNSSVGPSFSYIWRNSAGTLISSSDNDPTAVVTVPGLYRLIVTDATNNCIATEEIEIIEDITPPIAQINGPTTLTCILDTINLDGLDFSHDLNTLYQWSGPGIISTPNLSEIFLDQPGTYNLEVTNPVNGCLAQTSISINQDLSTATITSIDAETLTCNRPNAIVQVQIDLPIPEVIFSWTGPGIVSGESGPSLTVDQPGLYSVTVENAATGCVVTEDITVMADFAPPVADAGLEQTINCAAPIVTLQGATTSIGPDFSYSWTTTTGNVISDPTQATIEADQDGTYQLIVERLSNGCTDTSLVVVVADLTVPIVDAGSDTFLPCDATSLQLDGTNSQVDPGFQVQWFGDCLVFGQNQLDPTVDCEGVYYLNITNPQNGCVGIDSVVVAQDPDTPEAILADTAFTDCVSGEATLDGRLSTGGVPTWFFEGNSFNTEDLVVPVSTIGDYELVMTNPNSGCQDTSRITVVNTCRPEVSLINTPGMITCSAPSVELITEVLPVGPNYQFEWSGPDPGCFINGLNTNEVEVTCGGDYQLIVINPALGASDTLSVNILADQLEPNVSISTPDTITCTSPTVILDASSTFGPGTLTFSWLDDQGQEISDQPITTVGSEGIYSVEVIDTNNGCSSIELVEVFADLSTPSVNFSDNILPCFQDTLLISAIAAPSGNYSYQWTGANIIGDTNRDTLLVGDIGTYDLEVTNLDNGCVTNESIEVIQPVCPPCLEVGTTDTITCSNPTQVIPVSFCDDCTNCTINWSTPDGNFVSGTNTLTPEVDRAGQYILSVTNQAGLTTRVTVDLFEDITTPVVDAGPDLTLNCLENEGVIGEIGDPDLVYQWENSTQIILGNTAQLTVSVGDTYVLQVTDPSNGCIATDEVLVQLDTVAPVPQIVSPGELNCDALELTLSGSSLSNNSTFAPTWTGDVDQPIQDSLTFEPTIQEPGIYTLVLTDPANGCTGAASVEVVQNISLPTIQAISDQTLGCEDASVLLVGNMPDMVNYSSEWCLLDEMLDPVQCTAGLELEASIVGTYSFRVTDLNNFCSNDVLVNVQVDGQRPTIDAGPDLTVSCGNTSAVLAPTTPAIGTIEFEWVGPDNQVITTTDLTPEVSIPGIYTLNVTDLANQCASSDVVEIIPDTTTVQIDAGQDTTLNCNVSTITLTATQLDQVSNPSFNWRTPDGQIESLANNNLQAIINQPGTYIIEATNPANGCVAMDSLVVANDITLPVPVIEGVPSTVLGCVVDTINLVGRTENSQDISRYRFTWAQATGGNAGLIAAPNDPNAAVIAPGTYELEVVDNQNGCSATTAIVITEQSNNPEINIQEPALISCNNPTVELSATATTNGDQFEWFNPQGNLVSGSGATALVNQPGIYSLRVTDSNTGCLSEMTITVGVDTLAPQISIDQPGVLDCVIREVELTGLVTNQLTDVSFQWTTTDGEIQSERTQSTIIVEGTGDYILEVINNENGCRNTSVVTVQEIANPIDGISAEIDLLDCNTPNSAGIRVTNIEGGRGPFEYAINGGAFSTRPSFRELGAGTYDVLVTGIDGCLYDTSIVIEPTNALQVDLGPDITINLGDSILLSPKISGGDVDRFEWSVSDGTAIDSATLFPLVKPLRNTLYRIVVENDEFCLADDQILIKVNQEKRSILASAFSPNEDGVNDRFAIFDSGQIQKVDLFNIYDRWGTLIFSQLNLQPGDPDFGWDGTYNGEVLNTAVFTYIVKVTYVDGRTELIEGDVLLLR